MIELISVPSAVLPFPIVIGVFTEYPSTVQLQRNSAVQHHTRGLGILPTLPVIRFT
jgi:hypothetical protein